MSAAPALMRRLSEWEALRAEWAAGGEGWGLVPTMGYLHEGHAELIRRARQDSERVVVSVFVNPLQFGPSEDLASYPRDLDRDLALAAQAGASAVLHPEAGELYPPDFSTRVEVGGVTETLEGPSRPGHFTGVATVVLKLLNVVRPERAYFGEKDWQQLAVVRRMVSDLNVPTQIVGVPTVRAPSGLALSSRNSYLSPEGQARATVLWRALRAVQAAYAGGERRTGALREAGLAVLASEPEAELLYLSAVGPDLREPERLDFRDAAEEAGARVLIAARLFGVRLIDNLPLVPPAGDMAAPGLDGVGA